MPVDLATLAIAPGRIAVVSCVTLAAPPPPTPTSPCVDLAAPSTPSPTPHAVVPLRQPLTPPCTSTSILTHHRFRRHRGGGGSCEPGCFDFPRHTFSWFILTDRQKVCAQRKAH
ncbi:unnamed protein product [Urochloa humidicola]